MRQLKKFFDESILTMSWIFILLVAASFSAASGNSGTINRYVFAISSNYGGEGRPHLRYAEFDAKSFAAVIGEMGGTPKQNIIFVKEPKVSELEKQFDALDSRLKKNAGNGREEVLIYYSGHADENGLRLGNELVAWQKFRKRVDALNADVKIAVIDACGSGAITRAKGGAQVPAFMIDQSSDMKGYAFITSSTQDEASQESDKLKGSFFTHSLVSGLRGAGDLSGDGKVTLSEAYQFAFNETLQKTETTIGGAQHPSRDMSLTGTGDVVMTDLRSTKAGLGLAENLEGRVFIRDEKGELVAELYKKSGRAMSLGLPAGNYSVRLEKPAEYQEAKVVLQEGKIQNLASANFKAVAAEETVSRGEIGGKNFNSRIDSLDHCGKYRVTFNAADLEPNPRKGLMLGIFFNKSDDILLGTQVSLIGSVAKKEMHGAQVSGLFNMEFEKIEGIQISGIFNYTDTLKGAQLSSGANIAKVSDLQIGLGNISKKSKVQVGVLNVSENVNVQAGLMNVAKETNAPQVSVINFGWKTHGRQFGLINFVGYADKTPIGLLNFVGNGVWNVTGSINEMSATAFAFHFGTAYFFTSIEMSRELEKGFDRYEDIYESGLGIGTQFGKYGTHFELEYMFLFAQDSFDDDNSNYHHRLRFGGVARLLPFVGISAGFSLNLASEGDLQSVMLEPKGKWHDDWSVKGHKAKFWPGLYAGITLGRF